MQQLGHTDPRFTLKIYTHMMRRSEEERARLRALVNGTFVPYDPEHDEASNVVSLLRYRRRNDEGNDDLAHAA